MYNNNRLLCILSNPFNSEDISISNTRVLKIKTLCVRETKLSIQAVSEEPVLYGAEPTCNLSHPQLLLIEQGSAEGHLAWPQLTQPQRLPAALMVKMGSRERCIFSTVIKTTLKPVSYFLIVRPPGICRAPLNIQATAYSYIKMAAP